MVKKWTYGESWEKFPINDGEVWQAGKHLLACKDITNTINLEFFGKQTFDMSYVDPPWNTGNINSFYTKAEIDEKKSFIPFINHVIDLLKLHSPDINYMEMGKQNISHVSDLIKSKSGFVTNVWDIVYYRTKPCKLLRFSFTDEKPTTADFSGMDDDFTPHLAISIENNVKTVLDLCTGRGLTGRTAHNLNKQFFGTELNKRRIACLLDWYSQQNLNVKLL